MKNPGHVIIWPFHIDSTKTRGQGRKLPIARAIKQPNLREIVQAATILGYVPEPKEKSAMPSLHWEKAGNVTVKKTAPKVTMLKSIAGEIVKIRQKEAQAVEPKKDRR
ncbi:signal recognition particle protein Srp19 [Candidatus Bathyarchaeota archaeon]|nr:MAG: signal recognition particle protein Srp19 [Candidatus Bathyarchaeota archaeon]